MSKIRKRSRSPKPKEKEAPMSTDGIDVSELSIDGAVSFSAWDFAGQQVISLLF